MAARARRLKIFRAEIGFYEAVVAAPSRPEALKAFGVRQNLFSEGRAAEEADPQAVAAALEAPLVVLRRPIGEHGPFLKEPELPPAPEPAAGRAVPAANSGRPRGKAAPLNKKAPTGPDPVRLRRAEAALEAAGRELKEARARFSERMRALEEERSGVLEGLDRTRAAAEEELRSIKAEGTAKAAPPRGVRKGPSQGR